VRLIDCTESHDGQKEEPGAKELVNVLPKPDREVVNFGTGEIFTSAKA